MGILVSSTGHDYPLAGSNCMMLGRAFVPILAKRFPQLDIVLASRSSRDFGSDGIKSLQCDITNHESVRIAAKDCDLVINLVGIMDEQPPKYTFDAVQHIAPSIMAQTVAENRQKGKSSSFLHISAIGANSHSDIPYAKTKGLGEEAIHACLGKVRSDSGPLAMIIRPGLVISPQDQFLNVMI